MNPEFVRIRSDAVPALAKVSPSCRRWSFQRDIQKRVNTRFLQAYPYLPLIDRPKPVEGAAVDLDEFAPDMDAPEPQRRIDAMNAIHSTVRNAVEAINFRGVWLYANGEIRDAQLNIIEDEGLRMELRQGFSDWIRANSPETLTRIADQADSEAA